MMNRGTPMTQETTILTERLGVFLVLLTMVDSNIQGGRLQTHRVLTHVPMTSTMIVTKTANDLR